MAGHFLTTPDCHQLLAPLSNDIRGHLMVRLHLVEYVAVCENVLPHRLIGHCTPSTWTFLLLMGRRLILPQLHRLVFSAAEWLFSVVVRTPNLNLTIAWRIYIRCWQQIENYKCTFNISIANSMLFYVCEIVLLIYGTNPPWRSTAKWSEVTLPRTT